MRRRVLTDFIGDWRLERRIEDRLDAQLWAFEGTARFEPVGAVLAYHEAGVLRMGEQPGVQAARRYLWQSDGNGIAVLFDDGRAFHRFDPCLETPQDVHLCDPDTYQVWYDFAQWPNWQARWAVSGPRKDYMMTSSYTPSGQRVV